MASDSLRRDDINTAAPLPRDEGHRHGVRGVIGRGGCDASQYDPPQW